MDIMTDQQPCARVTIVATKIRVFTGIRLQRVITRRQPDVLLEATAGDIADALTGRRPIGVLVVKGEAPELLAALERAAAVIARDPEQVAVIDRAAGRPR
jgi:hypothetical protein